MLLKHTLLFHSNSQLFLSKQSSSCPKPWEPELSMEENLCFFGGQSKQFGSHDPMTEGLSPKVLLCFKIRWHLDYLPLLINESSCGSGRKWWLGQEVALEVKSWPHKHEVPSLHHVKPGRVACVCNAHAFQWHGMRRQACSAASLENTAANKRPCRKRGRRWVPIPEVSPQHLLIPRFTGAKIKKQKQKTIPPFLSQI